MDPREKIKEGIAQFFKKLYSNEYMVRPTLDGIEFHLIQEDLTVWLEREFAEEEISKALPDCVGEKAPGLEGFNFTFIKAALDMLKEDLCRMLSKFHRRGRLNKEITATFLCLIPKVQNPVVLDFRPISLVGCIYKFLSDFG